MAMTTMTVQGTVIFVSLALLHVCIAAFSESTTNVTEDSNSGDGIVTASKCVFNLWFAFVSSMNRQKNESEQRTMIRCVFVDTTGDTIILTSNMFLSVELIDWFIHCFSSISTSRLAWTGCKSGN